MKIIDASGEIYEGMWSYGTPFSNFKLVDIELPARVDYKSYSQAFKGFHMLTGTYMVAPSHGISLEKSYALHKITVDKLYNINAYVLKFNLNKLEREGSNPFVSYNDIKNAETEFIPEKSVILFSTGWGKHWKKSDYLENYWFLKNDAYEYILSKKPFILGLDTPSMDNLNNPQWLAKTFYNHNILLLAPLVNLEKITKFIVKISVCPLKVLNTTGLPCRVIVVED